MRHRIAKPSHASLAQRQLEAVPAALADLAADTVAEVATEAAAMEVEWAEVLVPVVLARSSCPTFVPLLPLA